MRVVVTGGAGFIGSAVCERLAADPGVEAVVAFDDLSSGTRANLAGLDVELAEGSILDRDRLGIVCRDADGIVHLAARPSVPRSIEDPVASHDRNATGTVNVLETARAAGNARTVVASSSSVYGANPTLPKVETLVPAPLSPYAASKLATESYALAWQHSFGLPVLALRFFNVFGERQAAGHAYAAVIPAFVDAALAGRPLPIHGDGTQTRDFTYVRTVAEVIARAVVDGVAHPGPVNLAFGSRISLLEVVAELEAQLGRPLPVEHLASRTGDVPHSQADNTLLQSLFPAVVPTSFRSGVERTIEWFRSAQGAGGAS